MGIDKTGRFRIYTAAGKVPEIRADRLKHDVEYQNNPDFISLCGYFRINPMCDPTMRWNGTTAHRW